MKPGLDPATTGILIQEGKNKAVTRSVPRVPNVTYAALVEIRIEVWDDQQDKYRAPEW
jgi:hypothetical protein